MIKLDISMALFLYLFFTVIVTLILWMWMGRRFRLKTFAAEECRVWQCSVCNYLYMELKEEDFSRCPQCGSINLKKS